MKLCSPDRRHGIFSIRAVCALAVAVFIPLLVYASAPSWWSERGVLVSGANADDYAPANQGQLKNIAKAAMAEMDAKLPGGAGEAVHNLVNSWSNPTAQPSDFAPVNLGQLKTVAKPFYDRLIAAGLVDFYPWLGSTNPPNDFQVANIGQTKKLFAFELTGGNTVDDPLGDRLAASQRAGNLALQAEAVWFWGNRFVADSSFQSTYPRRLSALSGIRSVSAGDDHRVALTENGQVLTWGKNRNGQLGDGTNMDRDTPIAVPNLANIISAKAGGDNTLALQEGGTVLAWGDNYYGQLGNGDNVASSSPVQVAALTNIRKIAAGPARSVALKEDGTVWTWGYDYYFNGQDISHNTPAQVSDLTDVVDITAGYEHTVAVKADGTVWAWGLNYSNQLGNGIGWWVVQDIPGQVPNLANVIKVASGFSHTLALLNDGTVWAWGANQFGQLGDGTSQAHQAPVQVTGLTDVIAIAAGGTHSLAMKADGTVWTWGDGASGTLPGVDLHFPQQVGLGLFDNNNNRLDDRWEMEYFGNLDATSTSDFDSDGISDLQEFQRGTDPTDYFNGTTPLIEILSGNNQFGDAGTIAPQPLTVRVKSANGQLAPNAPVAFSVSSGDGQLLNASGSSAQQMTLRTGADGIASIQFAFGQSSGISNRVSAGVGKINRVTAAFRLVTNYHSSPTPTATPDPNATPSPTPSPTASPTPPYRYAIIDLGKDMYPSRVTNTGWVLLSGTDPVDQSWNAYRWKAGVAERLTFSHGPGTSPITDGRDINEQGTVVGTVYNLAEHEEEAGMIWPAGQAVGKKVSAVDVLHDSGWVAFTYYFKHSRCSAVTDANEAYGEMYTGGGYFSFLRFGGVLSGYINNGCRWSITGALAEQMSAAHNITLDDGSMTWTGAMDSIYRVNSTGQWIGQRIFALDEYVPFIGGQVTLCDMTSIANGQPVAFYPIDLNNEGVVAGYNDSGMVIRTANGSETLMAGSLYPVAINNHVRPAPSAPAGASPTPIPTASPTPPPAPQILGWDGSVTVVWERQPDGQTWEGFGLEEMIPNLDGWQIWDIRDMNDEGVIVGTGNFKDPSNPQAQAEAHGFMLLPIELRDVNDPSNPGDDESITPWDTTQNIANKNIAWIDAHISDQNPAPRMPQLEFRIPGLRQGATIEAKLEVKYSRGNGNRTGRNQPEDTVKIPSDGSFKQVTGDTWQIWSEYQNEDFFGGNATLTYRVKSGSTVVLPEAKIDFRIGGKNPDDARCKSYIEMLPEGGPGGSLWFAYAIAKSESMDYNGQGSRYNQFLELPTHVQDVGRPLWSPDDETTPGGYGMFQVTGDASDSTANIPRKQIWNWQENVAGGLAILASKRTTAIAWMNQQKNAGNANGTTLPDHTVGIVTFSEGTARIMTHAVTIKLYNGASRAPAGFVDSGSAPGFRLDPQGSGHYCFWRNASNQWALNRFNDPPDPIPPFNYVARVCGEVEN